MTDSPRLGITRLEEGQALPEAVVNEAVALVEMFATRLIVKSQGDSAPPGSPANGDAYLVGAATTGAWVGQDENLALYINGAWEFMTPKEGFEIEVEDENAAFVLRGGTWEPANAASGAVEVQDEGATETDTLVSLNFTGAGVTATDDGFGNVDVAIPGGGGGGGAFRGALLTKAADQTAANYSSSTAIGWDSESYDTDSIHDNVTNNARLTVPSGVTKVRLQGQVFLSAVTANELATLRLGKGGVVDSWVGATSTCDDANSSVRRLCIASPVLTVSSGDYFELYLVLAADTSITVSAGSSWFAMEIIE